MLHIADSFFSVQIINRQLKIIIFRTMHKNCCYLDGSKKTCRTLWLSVLNSLWIPQNVVSWTVIHLQAFLRIDLRRLLVLMIRF